MVSGLLLSVLAIAYLALLFAVAFYGERKSVYPSRSRLRPYIYSLALGVYCTTWTFFGAVGTAARDGWAYVPIYLGPALVLLFATPFFARLVAIARAHNTTSIADFISSRFGKSPAIAALVTVIALTATVPYLALQYKAVATSIDVLTGTSAPHPAWVADTALWVALLMALFAVLFGTRRLDATEHHEGVMLAIAFESAIKLLAFVVVALFALMRLDDAPGFDATRLGGLADYRLDDDRLDGIDLLQSLRRGGVEPVPGALIAADHTAAVAERARSLGYPVLRKPLKPAALRALLGALATLRQSSRTDAAAAS